MNTTLTVNENWLEDVPTTTTKLNWQVNNPNGYRYLTPCTYNWLPKIQLKLSEIETLRSFAKRYPDVKPILNKFTQHIEVLVDF